MAVRSQLPRKKAPNPTDQHVGSRVRMRRMMNVVGRRSAAGEREQSVEVLAVEQLIVPRSTEREIAASSRLAANA